MKSDNIFKSLLSNTIIIFVCIVFLMVIITYLSFKKIETYKFLIVTNIIAGIIIFVLLSLNDHYKTTSGYDLLTDDKMITGGIDENKIKYFNSIFDGSTLPPTSNVSSSNSAGSDKVEGSTMDDMDKQIEDIIKELQ